MIRIMGLICVFGIASLCLATFIRASTAYARSARAMCPCWPGGITELEATLGPPKTINITLDPCDTKQQQTHEHGVSYFLYTDYADIANLGQTLGASVFIAIHTLDNINYADCDIYDEEGEGYENPQSDIPVSEAEACMHDILAYCRDYCMYNRKAQCQ